MAQDLAAAVSAALSSAGSAMQDDESQLSISLTPLYGIGELEPLCSLLKVDNFHILLDLGWDARFREEDLEILKRVVPDVDAVLITHADLAHMGALPYSVAKLGQFKPKQRGMVRGEVSQQHVDVAEPPGRRSQASRPRFT